MLANKDRKQRHFLNLYEPVHERFERFCRVRVSGTMDFRDLVNETLLIAFEKFEGLKSEKAFLSYLIGISIRLLANQRRKQRKIEPISEAILAQRHSPARSESLAEVQFLYQAIAQLPVEQKESIILHEISGFSVREIAALHQVSAEAVKKRLQRGRKRLAELLLSTPLVPNEKAK